MRPGDQNPTPGGPGSDDAPESPINETTGTSAGAPGSEDDAGGTGGEGGGDQGGENKPTETPMSPGMLRDQTAAQFKEFFDAKITEATKAENTPRIEALKRAQTRVQTYLESRRGQILRDYTMIQRDPAMSRLTNPQKKWVMEDGVYREATSDTEEGARNNQEILSDMVREVGQAYEGNMLEQEVDRIFEEEFADMPESADADDDTAEQYFSKLQADVKLQVKRYRQKEKDMHQVVQLAANEYFINVARKRAQDILADNGKGANDDWTLKKGETGSDDFIEMETGSTKDKLFKAGVDEKKAEFTPEEMAGMGYDRPTTYMFDPSDLMSQAKMTRGKNGGYIFEGSTRTSVISSAVSKVLNRLGFRSLARKFTVAGLMAHYKGRKMMKRALTTMQANGIKPDLSKAKTDTQISMLYMAANMGINPDDVTLSEKVKGMSNVLKSARRKYQRHLKRVGAHEKPMEQTGIESQAAKKAEPLTVSATKKSEPKPGQDDDNAPDGGSPAAPERVAELTARDRRAAAAREIRFVRQPQPAPAPEVQADGPQRAQAEEVQATDAQRMQAVLDAGPQYAQVVQAPEEPQRGQDASPQPKQEAPAAARRHMPAPAQPIHASAQAAAAARRAEAVEAAKPRVARASDTVQLDQPLPTSQGKVMNVERPQVRRLNTIRIPSLSDTVADPRRMPPARRELADAAARFRRGVSVMRDQLEEVKSETQSPRDPGTVNGPGASPSPGGSGG